MLIALEAQLWLFTVRWFDFQKIPSFHTYNAEFWGLGPLATTILLCWVNSLKEILMILISLKWHFDVLNIVHAINLRRTLIDKHQISNA